MMTCHVGERGIGKTYHLTKQLYNDYYRAGCLIVSNYDLSFTNYFISGKNEILKFIEDIALFKTLGYQPVDIDARYKSSIVVIAIDEAHLIFNSDSFKENRKNKFLLAVLAQARKLNIHIHLTTQYISKLDKDWRRYVDPYIVYQPLIPIKQYKTIHQISKFSGRPYYTREIRFPIPIFIKKEITLAEDQTTIEEAEIKSYSLTTSGWLSPKIYKMYDSNELVKHESTVFNDKQISYLFELRASEKTTPLLLLEKHLQNAPTPLTDA